MMAQIIHHLWKLSPRLTNVVHDEVGVGVAALAALLWRNNLGILRGLLLLALWCCTDQTRRWLRQRRGAGSSREEEEAGVRAEAGGNVLGGTRQSPVPILV